MLSSFNFCSPPAGGSDCKESVCNAGDLSSIPGSGRSPGSGRFPGEGRMPGEGNGYPLQYSFLENSMDIEIDGLQSIGWQSVRMTEQLTLSLPHPYPICILELFFLLSGSLRKQCLFHLAPRSTPHCEADTITLNARFYPGEYIISTHKFPRTS